MESQRVFSFILCLVLYNISGIVQPQITDYSKFVNTFIGNDDCGQMSAWYILSSLGFYPVNPAGNEFVLGAPQVSTAKLHLANDKDFTINAKNFSSANIYSEKAFLNGGKIEKPFITYQQIMEGGKLSSEMTSK